MYRKKTQGWGKHLDFILIDLCSMYLALLVSYAIRHQSWELYSDSRYQGLLIPLFLLNITFVLLSSGFKNVLRRGRVQEFWASVRQVAMVQMGLLFYMYVMKISSTYSRQIIIVMTTFYVTFTYLFRIVWKRHLRRRMRSQPENSLIIMTTRALVPETVRNIVEYNFERIRVAGLILLDEDARGSELEGIPVVAAAEDASGYICREWVDEVLVALPRMRYVFGELSQERQHLCQVRSNKGKSQGVGDKKERSADEAEKPDALDLKKPDAFGLKKPDAFGLEKPDAFGLEKPDALDLEKPDALGLEKPDALGLEKPDAFGLEKPDALDLEKPDALDLEKPDALGLEKPDALDLDALIETLHQMGVVVHTVLSDRQSSQGMSQHLEKFGNYNVLTSSINYAGSFQLSVKRLLDIIGGLAGCVLTLVLTVFLAPAIYLQSPGPVFFSQVRVGKNGRRFKIYKFRSMYMDADERKKELLEENRVKDDRMFKLDWDPRIIGSRVLADGTKKKGLGNFIRDYSLDEFPQFLNVLKGEMSLVGTRPPTVDEWERYQPWHRTRLAIRPGITGMWQISGRSRITDFEEVVRLDTQYINQWSLGLDVKILLKTVKVVVTHDGAM